MPDIEALSVSDLSTFAEAYRQHSADLVRFAGVLVGPDYAGDVVSSAIVRLLDGKFKSVENERAYLFQAVVNEARNWKRGEARRRVREEKSSGKVNPVYLDEPYPEVRRAVENLSVRQRAVVYLAYWEDLNDQMIAVHLGIGAGSVRRHLARARKSLRGVLDANI